MAEVRDEICRRLAGIETKEKVKILYACESGSRAWGFPSRNSDWDVRFVYVRQRDWYLTIDLERKRDVIELPIEDDLDINGWDIRKALWLFSKSNPPFFEWMHSPIVYQTRTSFIKRLRELLPVSYSAKTCHYHYLSIAKSNYREYLQGDTVRLKKYLYVLRPLLAVKWLEQGRGRVPMEFATLLGFLEDVDVKSAIEALVERKVKGDELDEGRRLGVLNDFIEKELARLVTAPPPESAESQLEPLNHIFRQVLDEAWA